MTVRIYPEKLREKHQLLPLLVDSFMLILISFNLLWIFFDALFATPFVQEQLGRFLPDFTLWYKEVIHPDFAVYDLIFVAIYVTELLIRWVIAIVNKTHHRWFFFPFVNWYDVLGCIPVGSFRWLRLLRVISIAVRLQRQGIVNLTDTYIARVIRKYYGIVVEEISDRVVINVLNGVQDELRSGNPITEQIHTEVLVPRQEMIAHWLSTQINVALDSVYTPNRISLHNYVNRVVTEAIEADNAVSSLQKIPMLGDAVAEAITDTVGEIVYRVFDRIVSDISNSDSDELILEISDGLLANLMEPSEEMSANIEQVLLDIIDVIKASVSVQQWKLQDED